VVTEFFNVHLTYSVIFCYNLAVFGNSDVLESYENNQRDALYRLNYLYYSKSDVQVSGEVFAHYQEHVTVFTVSGSVYTTRCTI